MPVDESRLLQAIAHNKDRKAFAELYDHCAPTAFGLAVKILRNEAEAEDVLQQAFLSLWQHAAHFDAAKGKVTTWLYVFIRNRCIDLIRRKKREAQESLDEVVENSAGFSDGAAAPLDALDGQERRARVSKALQELPEPQRRAIEAAYFEGLTQEEVAAKLDEPLGTIKTRTRLGMMKLAKVLHES